MADMMTLPNQEGELADFVRKKSLKDGVFDFLHQRIIAGKYPPGAWLRQEDISSQLGVSQTPVREALDLLVSVGLAERVPYRGVRVPELSAPEIVDAYILRLVLESSAAHLSALNITPEQLQTLQEIVIQTRDMLTLDDMSHQRQLNKRFHLLIAESSGNPMLSKFYEMVSNQFPDWRLYEYMFRHPELLVSSLEREYGEHQAIVDALGARDSARAAHQVAVHIHNLAHELVDYLNIPAGLMAEKEAQVAHLINPS
jgi:DNA-binding GntR family transcriptional regulator